MAGIFCNADPRNEDKQCDEYTCNRVCDIPPEKEDKQPGGNRTDRPQQIPKYMKQSTSNVQVFTGIAPHQNPCHQYIDNEPYEGNEHHVCTHIWRFQESAVSFIKNI